MAEKKQQLTLIDEKKCQGIIYGKCPLCNQEKVPLCCHHYPIPKSKGGKKCVRICLNCHFRFHFPKLKKRKNKRKNKKEIFYTHMPGVIDLRNTKFKNSEEFYEAFEGNWKKALTFLKQKDK